MCKIRLLGNPHNFTAAIASLFLKAEIWHFNQLETLLGSSHNSKQPLQVFGYS